MKLALLDFSLIRLMSLNTSETCSNRLPNLLELKKVMKKQVLQVQVLPLLVRALDRPPKFLVLLLN